MGKIILKGFVPPDDPMFTEGYSFFTIRTPKKKPSSQKNTDSPSTEDKETTVSSDTKAKKK